MKILTFVLGLAVMLHVAAAPASAARIGVDAVHGYDASSILATGSDFDGFRATIVAGGNTIVPLTSFDAGTLAGLDGVIVKTAFSSGTAYTSGDITALRSYGQNEVFLSDGSLWNDGSSDRPLTFGDNQKLLQNIVSYISNKGVLFVADAGSGSNVSNFNALVASYGITYSGTATDSSGRTVTGFANHPITAGVTTVGVDFQLPMTITSPALDLTLGSGQDNILAVAGISVPEPSSLLSLAFPALVALWRPRRRGQRCGSANKA